MYVACAGHVEIFVINCNEIHLALSRVHTIKNALPHKLVTIQGILYDQETQQ